MNFETLLSSLPQTGIEEWRKAAAKQLKGEALESINVHIDSAISQEPYAVYSPDHVKSVGGTYGWTVLSDLTNPPQLEADLVMEELEGGTQGFVLSDKAFGLTPEQLKEVRFDFLKLVLLASHSADSIDWMSKVIPGDQRSGATVYLSTSAIAAHQTLQQLQASGVNGHVILVAPDCSTEERLFQIIDNLKQALAHCPTIDAANKLANRLAFFWPIAADYAQNLIELRAIRLLSANCCHAFGLEQPLPSLTIIGSISGELNQAHLIDASTRAVAAASAGVDALVISPYSGGDSSINRRRARNIQHVLAIESGFNHVVDPLKGAAFVEKYSELLAEKVWNAIIEVNE